ncbi:MAG: shikimate dehydrogenase [Acidimicrobiia bacterium]|nr:shikimate dehydrogenase [Acidimicrobiia bacterium]
MISPIGPSTRVAGVIGDPVRHSLSPVLLNAAFRALDLDWVYVAFEVREGAAQAALDAMRTLDLAGLNATMPHKTAVAACCDDLTPDAEVLRSVNTVVPVGGGRLLGDSTDGEGFVQSLRDAGHDPGGRRVLLLGAGGAARAVALALGREGSAVTVAARRLDAAAAAAALAPAGEPIAWADAAAVAREADLVVNATPLGMSGDGLPLDPGSSGRAMWWPTSSTTRSTPLSLVAARRAGASTVDGLGMLVRQAALSLERWTGERAPVGVMRAAAEAAVVPR